jgi:hypothetical protein
MYAQAAFLGGGLLRKKPLMILRGGGVPISIPRTYLRSPKRASRRRTILAGGMGFAPGCRAKLGAALMTCVATGSRDQHELREKLGYAGQVDGAGGFAGEIVMCSFSSQPTARTASTPIAPRVLISDRPAPILPVDLSPVNRSADRRLLTDDSYPGWAGTVPGVR